MHFGLAAFELDRERGRTRPAFAELDHIGDACKIEPDAVDRERHYLAHTCLAPTPCFVNDLMQYPTFSGKPIFLPKPFQVDQSALPHTVHRMLQCRHGYRLHSMVRSMPLHRE